MARWESRSATLRRPMMERWRRCGGRLQRPMTWRACRTIIEKRRNSRRGRSSAAPLQREILGRFEANLRKKLFAQPQATCAHPTNEAKADWAVAGLRKCAILRRFVALASSAVTTAPVVQLTGPYQPVRFS